MELFQLAILAYLLTYMKWNFYAVWDFRSWCDIAIMLDISRSTLYRQVEEAGFPLQGYSNITNGRLDMVVHEIKLAHPYDGEVMIAAHLCTRGVIVPRACLWDSIHCNNLHTLARSKELYHSAKDIPCGIPQWCLAH